MFAFTKKHTVRIHGIPWLFTQQQDDYVAMTNSPTYDVKVSAKNEMELMRLVAAKSLEMRPRREQTSFAAVLSLALGSKE